MEGRAAMRHGRRRVGFRNFLWMVEGLCIAGSLLADPIWTTPSSPATPKDQEEQICDTETFHGRCSENEVIMMESALYGRMRAGKCISGVGQMQCSADVMTYLDHLCSGKRTCEVEASDIKKVAQPCKVDYTSYLEVRYTCIKVGPQRKQVCQSLKAVRVEEPRGYLATSMATMTGIGTPDCPWYIGGDPGQKVRLNVLDFSAMMFDPSGNWKQRQFSQHNCPVTVQLSDGGNTRSISLCQEGARERHLYTSQTRSLQLHFNIQLNKKSVPNFLIRYEVVGCPDIRAPKFGHVTRDKDTAVIRCNNTDETWYITCDYMHGAWRGDTGNCSSGSQWKFEMLFGAEIPFPQGLLVAVVIGIALGVALGAGLLAVVLVYRKRRRRQGTQLEEVDETSQRESSYYPALLKQGSTVDSGLGSTITHKSGARSLLDDSNQSRPLPDYPRNSSHGQGSLGDCPYPVSRHAHVYESPNPPPVRGSVDSGDPAPNPPVYFDLEADINRYAPRMNRTQSQSHS